MAFFGQLSYGVGINASPMDKGIAEVKAKLARLQAEAAKAGGGGGSDGGGGGGGILGSVLGSVGGKAAMIAGGAAAGVGVAALGIKTAADAALAYEKAMGGVNRAQALFGASSSTIEAFATSMATDFGKAKSEVRDAAVSFGGAFKAAGVVSSESARFGADLAKIGLDLAAFSTSNPDEVFTAMSAALRGEFDPLERFNIALTADKVAAKALEMGLASTGGEVGEYARKMATMTLIQEGARDAQGATERAAGSLGSQLERTGAIFSGIWESVGSATAGPLSQALDGLNDAAAAAANFLGLAGAAAREIDAVSAARKEAADAARASEVAAAKARADADAKARADAEEAFMAARERSQSIIAGLQDELGASLMGSADAWNLYKMALDGATESEVMYVAELMEKSAVQKAAADQEKQLLQKQQQFAAWDQGHRGIATAAGFGSSAAIEAEARFRAGTAAIAPKDDPIQRDLLKSTITIRDAVSEALGHIRGNASPTPTVMR